MPRMTGRTMQKMVAETLARAGGDSLVESAAPAAYDAAAAANSTQDKILAYCMAHGDAPAARKAIAAQAGRFGVALLLGLVVAAIIGAAAARAGFNTGQAGAVNALWLFGAVLGPHGLAFCLWIVGLAAGMRATTVPGAGRATVWLSRIIGRIGLRLSLSAAARSVLMARLTGHPAGRWSLSAISHAVWLAFLTGAILASLIMLSTRQYLFVWETTILTDSGVAAVIEALAAGPAALGFSVPDSDMIAVARVSGPGDLPAAADAPAWASFWIGSMLVYGLLPRLGVLFMSLGLLLWRLRGWRLDLGHPVFAALVPRLAPVMRSRDVVDHDDRPRRSGARQGATQSLPALNDPPPPPHGPVAILGWELDRPAVGWPPPGLSARVQDLGLIDGRQALAKALKRLGDDRPARVIVLADMATAPDRGVAAALRDIVARAGSRVVLALTNEAATCRRLGKPDCEIRMRDWVSMAHDAGVLLEMIARVDLDGPENWLRNTMGLLSGRDHD